MSKKSKKIGRRAFIITGSIAGVGLTVGVGGNLFLNHRIKQYSKLGLGEGASLNPWIRITPDNKITLATGRVEMGQGIYTALAQLIAEELEVPMERIEMVQPQPSPPYSNTYVMTNNQEANYFKGFNTFEKIVSVLPNVITGGSTSIRNGWNSMRTAGALAREMLKKAAALEWKCSVSDCLAENGKIKNTKTQDFFTYGQLVDKASQIKMETLPPLKNKKDFTLIGKEVKRIDLNDKVNGKAKFASDFRPKNLLFGVITRPSALGGTIVSIKNKTEIEALAGVKRVFVNSMGSAIVVAENTWQAIQGKRKLELEEENPNSLLNSEELNNQMRNSLSDTPTHSEILSKTENKDYDAIEGKVISSTYEVPYLAHAAMEPMNCTIQVNDDSCDVWVGHQASSYAKDAVADITGIKNIHFHTTLLGGGFGRKSETDFVKEAAATALEMKGVPIQLLYTREEDMKNDYYRPVSVAKFEAKVNEQNQILGWKHTQVQQSVSNQAIKRLFPAMAPDPQDDPSTFEGAKHLPYQVGVQQLDLVDLELPVGIGFWRSVGYSQNSFFAESFVNEISHSLNQDALAFRKSILKPSHKREKHVLEQLEKLSDWNNSLPTNQFHGLAIAESFGSHVGQVVVVEAISKKEVKLKKIYCVVDCGQTVNPAIIKSQIEGGIVFGLTAAIYGKITLSEGKIQQSNFPQYDMLRLKQTPEIEVQIVDSDEYPGGIGEPGLPPIAPALTEAIFQALGKRINSLPLNSHNIRVV